MTTSPMFPIFWLTGNSGAGKSTLALRLKERCAGDPDHPLSQKIILLDGDAMRRSISTDMTFTAEDRREHNLRVARLAAELQVQGFCPVVSVIAPFERVREEIDALCTPHWIYVRRKGLESSEQPYEPPKHAFCVLDTDAHTPEGCFEIFLAYVERALNAS